MNTAILPSAQLVVAVACRGPADTLQSVSTEVCLSPFVGCNRHRRAFRRRQLVRRSPGEKLASDLESAAERPWRRRDDSARCGDCDTLNGPAKEDQCDILV